MFKGTSNTGSFFILEITKPDNYMINSNTLQYLKDLKRNNNKGWFEEHRHLYETARNNFASFVEAMIANIGGFDAAIAPLQVKECVFRINRDVRFSKNKTPYKVNMAAAFSAGGKKASVAGYYFIWSQAGVLPEGDFIHLNPNSW